MPSAKERPERAFWAQFSSQPCAARKDPRQAEQEFFDAVDFFAAGQGMPGQRSPLSSFLEFLACLPGGSPFDFGKFLDFFRMVSAVHEESHAKRQRERGGGALCSAALCYELRVGRRRVPVDDLQRLWSLGRGRPRCEAASRWCRRGPSSRDFPIFHGPHVNVMIVGVRELGLNAGGKGSRLAELELLCKCKCGSWCFLWCPFVSGCNGCSRTKAAEGPLPFRV